MNPKIKKLIEKRDSLQNLTDITFYIPCNNEEKKIIPTLNKLISVVNPMNLTYELLIFNDGSTDNTRNLVEKYAKEHPEVLIHLINNKKRKGLGFNYIAGSFIGLGKYYMMICGDDSETEDSIREILKRRGTADMVIPYFGNLDSRIFLRRKMSKLFTAIVNTINGHRLKYYNGTVLHLRENIMRWNPVSSGFAYQAELLGILLDMNKTYIQVQVANKDREQGFTRAFYLLNILSIFHSLLQILFRRIRKTIWPM